MAEVEVTVAGRRYSLPCAPGQEARVEELARRFDGQLGDLEAALGDLGPERLFLAAALALLDEIEAGAASAPPGLDDRIRLLERRAATALSQAAARIEEISARMASQAN
jgi:cell division protein ZapA